MCLAIPARVTHITRIDPAIDTATVDLGGVAREVSIALVPEVEVGDYVLVHVGYALNRISQEEAEETLRLMAEMTRLLDDEMDQADPGALPA
ncbi:HypC/HybG/HupF family hydrogenase formation chaperone [Thermochromatium tepidum]|uniref:HypC/HybG/HupF family hydrogenase formation chaperone n=1 Tax=Thermochromatium tepidum ATCC 43061 TaxID=316276 RepID=A0A6I6E9S4_THETI|nr:HypC/HybG/HupF family hydrogenase formation chaperone [Thermochromatium tepidum]QGU33328.1 HypC/HybG/HupF family hydrogenase formation chaperone [Thermochromatium tepidum ATCC 43061]